MTTATLKIAGRKFRVIPEREYQSLRAVARWRDRQAKLDAADLAEAERRLKNPKRKTVSLASLKAQLKL